MHLDAIKDNIEQGKNNTVPDPPLKFVILQYRQKMGISYQEAISMPYTALIDDLEMFDLMDEYRPRAQPTPEVIE